MQSQDISPYIYAILSQNKSSYSSVEDSIANFFKSNPTKLTTDLMQKLRTSTSKQEKAIVSTIISRLFSAQYVPFWKDNAWFKVNNNIQQGIKRDLLEIFHKETDKEVLKGVAWTLASIVLLLQVSKEVEEADKLVADILNFPQGYSPNHALASIYFVEKINLDYLLYKDLDNGEITKKIDIFEILNDPQFINNHDIRLAALNVIQDYICDDDLDSEKRSDCLTNVFKYMCSLSESGEENKLFYALEKVHSFGDLYDSADLNMNFAQISDDLIKILKRHQSNVKVSNSCLNLIIAIAPSIEEELSNENIEIIYKIIIKKIENLVKSNEQSQEWLSFTEETFNKSNDELLFYNSLITSLWSLYNENECYLKLVKDHIHSAFTDQTNDTWLLKCSALAVISQGFEDHYSMDDLEEIMPYFEASLANDFCNVRFMAISTLGHMLNDLGEACFKQYHTRIIPPMIQLLDDKVPIIRGFSSNFFVNAAECMTKDEAKNYDEQLVRKILKLIESERNDLRELLIPPITSISEVLGEDFLSYSLEFWETIKKVMPSIIQEKNTIIMGVCCECISNVQSNCIIGVDQYLQSMKEFRQLLNEILVNTPISNETFAEYLTNSWISVIKTTKNRINDKDLNADEILAGVFDSIILFSKKVINLGLVKRGNQIQFYIPNIHSHMETTIFDLKKTLFIEPDSDLMSQFLELLGNAHAIATDEEILKNKDYLFNIISNLLIFTEEGSKRTDNACDTLESLIERLVETDIDPSQVKQMAHDMFKIVLNKLQLISTPDELAGTLMSSLSSLFENCKMVILDQADMDELAIEIEKFAKDGHEDTEKEHEDSTSSCDSDDDDSAILDDVGSLLGSLLKHHFETSKHIVYKIFEKYAVPDLMGTESSTLQNDFALFLLCDISELPFEQLVHFGPLLQQVVDKVIALINDQKYTFQQAAAYTANMLAKNAHQMFQPYSKKIIGSLLKAMNTSKTQQIGLGSSKKRSAAYAFDNVYAAMGSILLHQKEEVSKNFDVNVVVTRWLEGLPLKKDREESKDQNEILATLLENDTKLVCGIDNVNMREVLRIISEAIDREKFTKKETVEKFKAILAMMKEASDFKDSFSECLSSMDETMKKRLIGATEED